MRILHHSSSRTSPEEQSPEELHSSFPQATLEECRRFHQACPKDAAAKISAYLKWREKHHLDSLEDITDDSGSDDSSPATVLSPEVKDAKEWEEAVRKAIFANHTIDIIEGGDSKKAGTPDTSCEDIFYETVEEPEAPEEPDEPTTETEKKRAFYRFKGHRNTLHHEGPRPCATDSPKLKSVRQCAFAPCLPETGAPIRDIDGCRILTHFPGLIDLHNASNEFYTEAIALYLNSQLDRHDEEMYTVVVHCLPGKNWPNPPALSLIGFIRHVCHALHDLYPHRVHRCILYPVPRAALYLWKIMSTFLDPSIRSLIVLIPGPKGMLKYMDEETWISVEKVRDTAVPE